MYSKTTTNYTGRQLDLEILQSVVSPDHAQKVIPGISLSGGKIVSGIEKMVQRYLVLFLTKLGSVHFDKLAGSDLLSNLAKGTITDTNSFTFHFNIANEYALSKMKEDSESNLYGPENPDEAIDSAELKNIDLDYGSSTARISIKLTSKAGNNYYFVVPLHT